jgi:hypothetical protein
LLLIKLDAKVAPEFGQIRLRISACWEAVYSRWNQSTESVTDALTGKTDSASDVPRPFPHGGLAVALTFESVVALIDTTPVPLEPFISHGRRNPASSKMVTATDSMEKALKLE